MGSRENRRLLVFVLVVTLLFALAAAAYHRLGVRPSPEQRAREQAEQVREKVRDLTHGK